jgi:predicted nucleic acid-binding protein
MSLVLDTSVSVALLVREDPDHERCVDVVGDIDEELVVPGPTLVEIDFWLRKYRAVRGWQRFVDEIADGRYRLHSGDERDVQRAAALEVEYADLGLGFVDASVIATCEKLGETKVATLDRRHFSVIRPRHCDALTLLPE